jgi:hypothetical protein
MVQAAALLFYGRNPEKGPVPIIKLYNLSISLSAGSFFA